MKIERVLSDWFWPWQIYFDKDLETRVKKFALNLNIKEQEYYSFLIDFFGQSFSFQMLLDYIETNPQKSDFAIKKAKETIKNILFVPQKLKEHFIKKINSFDNQNTKIQLLEILNFALNSKNKVDFDKYYSFVLKDKYKSLKSQIDKFECDENLKLISEQNCNVELLHNKFVEYITKPNFKQFWGGVLPKYNLIKKEALGYGEYWDADFFDAYKQNTLVIYQNSNIKNLDVLYTLFHEVYPGHGNFYETIKQNTNYVDLGAVMIIEGFATFCELNIGLDKNYEKYYLNKYYHFLKSTLSYNCQNLDDYELLNAVNYPLYKENYYIGALCLIDAIKNSKDLHKFYDKICNNNLTDLLIL